MAINIGDAILFFRDDSKPLAQDVQNTAGTVNSSFQSMADAARPIGIAMTAMGTAITGAMGYAAKGAMDFRNDLAEVATLGVQDLDALGDTAKDITRTFGVDLSDAVKATYFALSKGAKEAEIPYVLAESSKAAKAGITDLSSAVSLGTGVANAFGVEFSNMGGIFDAAFIAVQKGDTTFQQLVDTVGKAAPSFQATGLSVDELFASIAAMTLGGIKTAESVTSLKAVIAAFQRQGRPQN